MQTGVPTLLGRAIDREVDEIEAWRGQAEEVFPVREAQAMPNRHGEQISPKGNVSQVDRSLPDDVQHLWRR